MPPVAIGQIALFYDACYSAVSGPVLHNRCNCNYFICKEHDAIITATDRCDRCYNRLLQHLPRRVELST